MQISAFFFGGGGWMCECICSLFCCCLLWSCSLFLSFSFSSRLINMSIISLRCAGMAVKSDPVYDAIHVTYYWSLESRGEQLKSPSRRFVFAHIYPLHSSIHPCLAALSPLVSRKSVPRDDLAVAKVRCRGIGGHQQPGL